MRVPACDWETAAFEDLKAIFGNASDVIWSVLTQRHIFRWHINNRVMRCNIEMGRQQVKHSILKILGGMPIHASHSPTEIIDYVLNTWTDGLADTEGVMKKLLELIDDPDLDARMNATWASTSNQPRLANATANLWTDFGGPRLGGG